jgi:O-antigen/teichoic acid export membrane protein
MAERSSSTSLQFLEGAIWTSARNLLQLVLSLTALAIVARELGPQAYGTFGVAMVVIGVAEMIVGGALTDSLVQRKDLSDGHIDATFWLSSSASLVLGVLIAAYAAPLARLAGSDEAAHILTALACLLPLTVSSRVPMALLARELRFRAASMIGALATILSCGTGILLALRDGGIWTLVVMEGVRSCVNLVGAFLAVQWRPGRRGRWRHLGELSRFNAGTLATYAVGYADNLLPRLLVSHLMGAETLGLFMLATRVSSELSHLLTAPLHTVAMAACARAQGTHDELHRMVLGLYRASRLVVFPAFLGMAALAPYLVPWVLGADWQAAVLAIQILMLGGLRVATGAFNTAILFGVGQVGSPLILFSAGCLLHVLLIPLLAPWGVAGVAIAMVGRQFGNWPLACVLINRAIGLSIRRQIGGGMSVLCAAAAMAGIVWLLALLLAPRLPMVAVITGVIVAGMMVYMGALRVLAPGTLRAIGTLFAALLRRDRARLEAILSQNS